MALAAASPSAPPAPAASQRARPRRRRITSRGGPAAVCVAAAAAAMTMLLAGTGPWRGARAFRTLSLRHQPSSAWSRRQLASAAASVAARRVLGLQPLERPLASALALAAARRPGGAGAGKQGQGKSDEDEYNDSGAGGGAGPGKGPWNRRRVVSNPSDEEEFAALSAKSLPTGADGGSSDSEREGSPPVRRPVAVKRLATPSGPKKKAPLRIDPNWRSGKPLRAAAPAAVVPAAAAARVEYHDEDEEEEEEDDDDMELLDLPKDIKIRGLDSRAYEEARRLANLDDDDDEAYGDEEDELFDDEDEEEDEEDFDFDDEGEEDDDEELDLPPPSSQPLSMAERLKMAQSGNIYNPYVASLYGGGGSRRGLSTKAGGGDDEDEDEEVADEDRWEEVEDDYEDEEEGEGGRAAATGSRKQLAAEAAGPVRYQYKIVMDAGTCPGCGNAFQTHNDSVPGFVPGDVYQRLQNRLMASRKKAAAAQARQAAEAAARKKAKMNKGKAVVDEEEEDLYQGLTAEEEVELLISGKDRDTFERERAQARAVAAAAAEEEEEIEEEEEDEEESEGEEEKDGEDKMVICQRCHKLKHYGEVEDSLRPGWSDNELLTPERFRDLVSVVRKKRCAVVCLVDIFDFHGSLLYNLPRIVGENPVLVAVNKADLLPADFSEDRVRVWVKQELERIGVKDASTRNIHLISCKTGHGVKPLLRAMKALARQRKRDLYVIGAANVGKSTFINRLIETGRSGGKDGGSSRKKKGAAQAKSKQQGTLVTTSPLPGTTLNFIEVDLGDKVSLYDTPGLILPHQLTTMLTTEELKAVIPQKRINHVTLRLREGKSVLLGGLVRLDMVEGRPFLFTFYVSNEVKLHQTGTDRADEFLERHVGELVFPPYSAERLAELGEWVPREFEIEGTGWKTSAVDIVISGLGWISVTGALGCKVRVMAPEAVGVRLRAPLMPYETWDTTAKWTGLRAVKGNKKKGGSR